MPARILDRPLYRVALNRRRFLIGAGATLSAAALPWPAARALARPAGAGEEYRLTSATAEAPLGGVGRGPVSVWAYNGSVPGSTLRVRQGERVRIVVDNALAEPTTVHWHGVRLPNPMDGVPHVTQAPIPTAGRFVYEFTPTDAGTFWYHPHIRSEELVGRGLYGALIVEEREPPAVDRELVWVLDDWRINAAGQLSGGYGNLHDRSHGGRVGNWVTINGKPPAPLRLAAGERVRLRLINAANARIFGLVFRGHRPWMMALDGQPLVPYRLDEDAPVVVAPGMRVDLLLDADARGSHAIEDVFYEELAYRLTDIRYAGVLRAQPLSAPAALPANPLPEPDLVNATTHEVVLDGGMMGDMSAFTIDGRPASMPLIREYGVMWGMGGVAATRHNVEPALVLERGRSYVLRMPNRTAWHHPMHLHGHSFRVIARNGEPTARREWQDTVLVAPRETVDVAFVADNPGDWMFHCHILEHQAAGMMTLVRVR